MNLFIVAPRGTGYPHDSHVLVAHITHIAHIAYIARILDANSNESFTGTTAPMSCGHKFDIFHALRKTDCVYPADLPLVSNV